MADNYYAVTNLRTIKENIMAYASHAEGYQYTPIYEKIEAAQQAVQQLIDAIEGKDDEPADPADTTPADDPAQDVYAEYSPDMRKAVAYINDQLEPEDKAIIAAQVSKNFKQHMNPAYGIDDDKIIDLLEEYGDDHDLGEGGWEEECDLDDIVLLIDFETTN